MFMKTNMAVELLRTKVISFGWVVFGVIRSVLKHLIPFVIIILHIME